MPAPIDPTSTFGAGTVDTFPTVSGNDREDAVGKEHWLLHDLHGNAIVATQTRVLADEATVTGHIAATTAVHGIADTSILATTTQIAAAVAGLQPHDLDLDAIAALTTTPYGRSLLTVIDSTALRGTLGLGTASTHATGDFDTAGAAAAVQAASQPLSSTLTTLAAASTTSYGVAFLGLADAAAARTYLALGTAATQATGAFDAAGAAAAAQAASQPLDSDLTTLAALTATTDSIIQSKASAWTVRTPAQFKVDLVLVKGDVALGNVDNTSDANKPVSTATQTALNLKANLSGPTFTGVGTIPTGWSITAPVGLVRGDVGLPNVDNTSDATKNSATATLTNKTLTSPVINTPTGIVATDIASGVFAIGRIPTGTTSSTVPLGGVITAAGPTGDASHTLTLTYNAAGQVTAVTNNSIAIAASQVTSGLAGTYAPLASPAFTGTPTAPDPSSAQGLATKAYVDAAIQGLSVKSAAQVATTANVTLSGEQTIDGVTTSASRILVKNQSTASQNGLYTTAAGSWTRATDMDANTEVPGAFVFVDGGGQAGTGWTVNSAGPFTLGTTAISWTQFSGGGTYSAGTGITLTGTTFSLTDTATKLNVSSNLSDLANAGTARTNLGLVIGTNVQAWNARLDTFAAASDTGTGNYVRATSAALTTPTGIVATDIASGTFAIGRIPTGTTSSTVPLGGVITAGGPQGDASHTQVLTWNAAGQVTTVTNTAIAIAESAVTNLVTDLGTITTNIATNTTAIATKQNVLSRTAVKTAATYTAAANELVPADTTSNSITVTLPTAPVDRTLVGVRQIIKGSTNTVTISTAGSDVFSRASGPTSATLTLAGQELICQYDSATSIWTPISDGYPLAQIDLRYLGIAATAGGSLTGTYPNPTIAAGAVTLAMQVNAAANSIRGNNTGSAATPIDLTVAQTKTLLNYVASDFPTLAPLASPTFTGTVTAAALTATGITSLGSAAQLTVSTGGNLSTSGNLTTTGSGTLTVAGTASITGHVTVEGVTSTGATGTGKFVFDGSPTIVTPTISGHAVIEGVTPTGATGTGNLVFSASPTFTGTITYPAATISSYAHLPTSALAATYDRMGPTTGAISPLVSGTLYMVMITLTAGQVITSISTKTNSQAAVSPTHQIFGLFTSARVNVRYTSDDTTTAWAANTVKTLNLSSTYTVPTTGDYYIGLMVAAGTVPNFSGLTPSGAQLQTIAPTPFGATSDTGLTNVASMPSTAGTITAGTLVPYVWVS